MGSVRKASNSYGDAYPTVIEDCTRLHSIVINVIGCSTPQLFCIWLTEARADYYWIDSHFVHYLSTRLSTPKEVHTPSTTSAYFD